MPSDPEESKQSEQHVQAAPQAAPVVKVSGPPLTYKLQFADHDVRRAYNFTEANAQRGRYQKHILDLPGNPESWFSLYELQKVRQAEPHFKVNVARNSFGDLEETVRTLEDMWKACGYEFMRRPNFNDAVALNLERTAQDVGLMISLLMAENDWETSIAAYRRGDEALGKAKYLVVADPVHTPQTKSAPKALKQIVDTSDDSDDEDMWAKPTKVKKKLDFSSGESDGYSPVKASATRKSADPVVESFVKLMQAGHMTMEELARVTAALTGKSTKTEESHQAFKPATEPRVAAAGSRRNRYEVSWENEVEMTADDDSTWSNPGRPVTVLQNLSIRTFDGAKASPEEARAWLSKFLHVANLSGWNGKQRLEMFVDSMTNPAKQFVQQLPTDVKKDWRQMLETFKRKYCTDIVPPRLQYYKLTQKTDELASNYLYRLNGAALRAGIDFRDETQPDNLEDHLQQFFDTLHDKALQMQFRFTAFESIDDLERKLLQYESTQLRPTKKTVAKKSNEENTSDVLPAVNRIDQRGNAGGGGNGGGGSGGGGGGGYARPSTNEEYKPVRPANANNSSTNQRSSSTQDSTGQSYSNSKPRCENCNKSGHTVDNCWQLLTCEFCEQRGHPIKYCRDFIEKMAALHRESKGGVTAAKMSAHLNN